MHKYLGKNKRLTNPNFWTVVCISGKTNHQPIEWFWGETACFYDQSQMRVKSLVKKRVILTLICGTVILVSGFLSNILKRRSFKSSDMSALLSGRKTLSMSKLWDGEGLSGSGEILTSQEAPLVGSWSSDGGSKYAHP